MHPEWTHNYEIPHTHFLTGNLIQITKYQLTIITYYDNNNNNKYK